RHVPLLAPDRVDRGGPVLRAQWLPGGRLAVLRARAPRKDPSPALPRPARLQDLPGLLLPAGVDLAVGPPSSGGRPLPGRGVLRPELLSRHVEPHVVRCPRGSFSPGADPASLDQR